MNYSFLYHQQTLQIYIIELVLYCSSVFIGWSLLVYCGLHESRSSTEPSLWPYCFGSAHCRKGFLGMKGNNTPLHINNEESLIGPSEVSASSFNHTSTNTVSYNIWGSYEILAQWATYVYTKASTPKSKFNFVNICRYLLCAINQKNHSFPWTHFKDPYAENVPVYY